MKAHVSVAVLVSAGRHPKSGAARACRGDAVALALGKQIAGDALRVIHAGSVDEPALQDYLALGAGTVEVLGVSSGTASVAPIADALRDCDLIVTGMRAETGTGSGLFPYALAKALGRPIAANVLEAKLAAGEVRLRQFLPKGKRRGLVLPLPAVVAVHPLAAVTLSYAHARRLSGRIVRLGEGSLPSGKDAGASTPWHILPPAQQRQRLKAEDKKPAHARLQAAITTESKGGVVVIEGSHVDKAQVILAYLREHRLIDF